MANSAIVPPKTPLTDPRSGLIAREWYLFFLTLSNLVTQNGNTLSIDDLAVSPAMQDYDQLMQGMESLAVSPVIEHNPIQYDPTGYCAPSTANYLTANQAITLTGDVTGSGTTSIATTLATVGTAGTYTKVTVNAKGLTTSGAQASASDLSNGTTGSGAIVLATSPSLTTPNIGTPTAGVLSSCTGLPVSTGISGLGTGVATALAVNTGTSGAFVVNGGALGTPSSGTVTNLTGTASININGTVGATTPNTGSFTTVTASGLVDISGASAGQIKFPATQNASSNANTLDDYEEGSWTPTVSGSVTPGAGTYSNQVGRYTKIGNFVCATAYLAMSAHTGTGDMQLTGLPFASLNVGNYTASPTFGLVNNVALTAGNILTGFLPSNSTAISLYQYPTGGGGISAVPLDVACDIIYTICYHT